MMSILEATVPGTHARTLLCPRCVTDEATYLVDTDQVSHWLQSGAEGVGWALLRQKWVGQELGAEQLSVMDLECNKRCGSAPLSREWEEAVSWPQ